MTLERRVKGLEKGKGNGEDENVIWISKFALS